MPNANHRLCVWSQIQKRTQAHLWRWSIRARASARALQFRLRAIVADRSTGREESAANETLIFVGGSQRTHPILRWPSGGKRKTSFFNSNSTEFFAASDLT